MRYSYLRREGAAMHPDDASTELSDSAYEKQLRAYLSDTGDILDGLFCSRTEIQDKILAEAPAVFTETRVVGPAYSGPVVRYQWFDHDPNRPDEPKTARDILYMRIESGPWVDAEYAAKVIFDVMTKGEVQP